MYRRKLFVVTAIVSALALAGSGMTVLTVRTTGQQLAQAGLARELLSEHLQLSVIAYRLFKQLTDGLVLGEQADQSTSREKRATIADIIARIRALELQQRAALGRGMTAGSVEDTDRLERLIGDIASALEGLGEQGPGVPRDARLAAISEDRIDIAFREAVNAAVRRQRNLITTMEDSINYAQMRQFIAAGVLLILTLALTIGGGGLLSRGIARPLAYLHEATEALRRGELHHRVGRNFDREFEAIALAFDDMAGKLLQRDQERERARADLENEVSKRTAELQQLNQRLITTDAARRDFLAEVSHEIRTPLSVILGEAQVALRHHDRAPEATRDSLETVQEHARQLSRLVDDMLFVARAEAQVLRLETEPVDVLRLCMDQAPIMQRRQPAPRIDITTAEDTQDHIVIADYGRLHQLITILLDNAIRHGADESAEITIVLDREAALLRLRVLDNGPGFSIEELPLIFERFHRGRSRRGGSGLGLAVARAIVQAHGGRIAAENREGGGACMCVWLPLT